MTSVKISSEDPPKDVACMVEGNPFLAFIAALSISDFTGSIIVVFYKTSNALLIRQSGR